LLYYTIAESQIAQVGSGISSSETHLSYVYGWFRLKDEQSMLPSGCGWIRWIESSYPHIEDGGQAVNSIVVNAAPCLFVNRCGKESSSESCESLLYIDAKAKNTTCSSAPVKVCYVLNDLAAVYLLFWGW